MILLKQLSAIALLTFASALAFGQSNPNSLGSVSLGSMHDQLEGGTVRLMAKIGDALGGTDDLYATDTSGRFWVASREFAIDAADKGKFGNASVRLGARYYILSQSVEPGAPIGMKPIYDGGLSHVFNFHLGADTDRNARNKDVLVEAAYLPMWKNPTNSCLSIGPSGHMLGVAAQVGHQKRSYEPAVVDSKDESATLKRAKFEYRATLPLSFKCDGVSPNTPKNKRGALSDVIFSEISMWSVLLHSTVWRDFTDKKTFKKHEVVLRIPMTKGAMLDLRRDIGASPVEFDTGSKYGANVTIEF